jgi:hypothetical protein
MGRKSIFSDELAEKICEQIAGGNSIRAICEMDGMPSAGAIFQWLAKNDDFAAQYAMAKRAQAEYLAEQILEIADDGRNDTYVDENGHSRTDQEVLGRSRLRVDARKWLASKMFPTKYGDRVTQELIGSDGGPVQIERIERVIIDH